MSCNDQRKVVLDMGCIPPAHQVKSGEVDCSVNPPILHLEIINEKFEDVSLDIPLCIAQDWTIDKPNITQDIDLNANKFIINIPCIDRRSGAPVGNFDLDFSSLIIKTNTTDLCDQSTGNGYIVNSVELDNGIIQTTRVKDHSTLHEVVDIPATPFGEFVGGDPAVSTLEAAPSPSYREVKFTNPNPCREMRGTVYIASSFASDIIDSGGFNNFYVIGQSLYIDGVLIPERDGRNLPGYNVTKTIYTEAGGSGVALVQGITDSDLPIIYYNVTIPPGETICVGQDVGFSETFLGFGNKPANVSIESRQIGIIANTA